MEVRLGGEWARTVLMVLEVLVLVGLCNGGKKTDEAIKKKCETCKSLSEGFKEGIERTARYMYDGGDADWEEKKLGSYANSEMRFIEITEQLCESKEHDCHNMLEAKEEMLEHWWKEHQEENPDLFQWFCIDNYKVCCPENRYGPECEVCPYGLKRPCKDNGKCSGAGTRGGTGKCKCTAGYKGELCDICKDGYYQEMKNETHIVCKVCHKACTALCTGEGPKGCKKCKAGWLWSEEEGCQDVDECATEQSNCGENQFCENTEGSFKCVECDNMCDQCIGEGNDHCIKCKTGYHMVDGACEDVDECEPDDACSLEHMTCHNVPGSYYCDCSEGYTRVGNECIDDEVYKAENETDQTPGDSSEGLESTTSQQGDVIASEDEDDDTVVGEESNAMPDELVKEDSVKTDDNILKIGQGEIPTSADGLGDGSSQNSENSNDSGSFTKPESDTIVLNGHQTTKDKAPHEEL